MNEEKMSEINEKIKNKTATKEEIELFFKGFADLTEEIKNELKK